MDDPCAYVERDKGEDRGKVNGAAQWGNDAPKEIEVRVGDAPVGGWVLRW